MLEIREINEVSELPALRPAWEALAAITPGADFFRTPDWLNVYWRHFGAGQRLRVLEIREAGRTTGIVPLVVYPERTRLGSVRVLTYPLSSWGSFYGPLAAHPPRALAAALAHVRRMRRDWDYLELRWVHAADEGPDAVAEQFAAARQPVERRADKCIPWIDQTCGWEAYWAARSGDWRSNCRRNEKKAIKAGCVEHVRYRPRGTAHGEDDSTTGTTITHAGVREFLRDVHAAAARAGGLDVNLLTIDGVPAAFEYNYVFRGYVSSLRRGFDPAFSRQGVGTTLMCRMLRDGFERGDHTFDFLPDALDIKRHWQTSLETSYRYAHYPLGSWRAQALRMKRWLVPRHRRRHAVDAAAGTREGCPPARDPGPPARPGPARDRPR
jgi:CelD/BcsL family acetyltransferase involved in cellulose biosynthesis